MQKFNIVNTVIVFFLFWINLGDDPKIERSLMDGSLRSAIVKDDLVNPQGLVIDFEERKLFWADAHKDCIEIANLNGKERRSLMPVDGHPIGLTQYGDHIYWTSLYKNTFERADKLTGRKRTTFHTALLGAMEIHSVAAEKQVGMNPCSVNNGYCSHLCLYQGGNSYVCSCPDYPDNMPCNTEPTMKVILPNSELDLEDDLHFPTTETMPPNMEGTSTIFIVVAVTLCVLAAVVAFLSFVFLYHKRRRRSKKYLYPGGRNNMLTFSNPNYSSSSAEQVSHPEHKRSHFWRRFKYDKSQERVYDVPSESDKQTASPEVVSLIPAPPSPSHCAVDHHATPSDGVDNPDLKTG